MARIEVTKVNADGTTDVLFLQAVRDNTNEITELLCELNIQ